MLVNGKEILINGKLNKKAIYQFNINNLEWTKWILEKCNELNEPVILGASEGAIKYMGGYDVVVALVNSLIKDLNVSIDVCLHLDHGKNIESCIKAIDAGFTSVMIDLSLKTIEENINETKKLVKYAHERKVMVEAELASMSNIQNNKLSIGNNTNVSDCIRFVKETDIDSLAAAVGTVHGLYKGELNIDYNLINEISNSLLIPLVLHGGSGLSNDILKKCVESGITKININSDLQYVWSNGVKEFINNNEEYDPRKIISGGEKRFKDEIERKYNINIAKQTVSSLINNSKTFLFLSQFRPKRKKIPFGIPDFTIILLNDIVYSLNIAQFLFEPVKIILRRGRYFKSNITDNSAFSRNRINVDIITEKVIELVYY